MNPILGPFSLLRFDDALGRAISMAPTFSFILPIFNEEQTLPELYRRMGELLSQLKEPAEVILIDDGSRDRSYALCVEIAGQDPRFKVIHFSRNFGHQIAITAGMDFALGKAVVIMDADLQDPPEVVLEMVSRWREGYEVVYAVRDERQGESFFKQITAKWFYRLLGRLTDISIPNDTGDFRLVDRKALDAFKALREGNRYVRGMFSWVGFKQIGVHYVRHERFAGETKYPFRKMFRFATDAVLSFSNIPLRLALNIGFVVSGLSFVVGIGTILVKSLGFFTVPGWTSTVMIVAFMGGFQLMVLGILGEYISRIYDEVKQRPLYVVRSTHGFEASAMKHAAPERVFLHMGAEDQI